MQSAGDLTPAAPARSAAAGHCSHCPLAAAAHALQHGARQFPLGIARTRQTACRAAAVMRGKAAGTAPAPSCRRRHHRPARRARQGPGADHKNSWRGGFQFLPNAFILAPLPKKSQTWPVLEVSVFNAPILQRKKKQGAQFGRRGHGDRHHALCPALHTGHKALACEGFFLDQGFANILSSILPNPHYHCITTRNLSPIRVHKFVDNVWTPSHTRQPAYAANKPHKK